MANSSKFPVKTFLVSAFFLSSFCLGAVDFPAARPVAEERISAEADACANLSASPVCIIPAPVNIVKGRGVYILAPEESFRISATGGIDEGELKLLKEYIAASPLNVLPAASKASRAGIRITIGGNKSYRASARPSADWKAGTVQDNLGGAESYGLEISSRGIEIKSGTVAGAFYAVQSLLQMTRDGQIRELECCTITDFPRFSWRGVMVDVSRHFRSIEFLKKQMDAMALYKLNRMHLHLTDAAGWRLEIEAYPRLSGFGAWRPQRKWTDWTAAGGRYCDEGTPAAYGGYYTKEDIKELIEYARARHIEVIPEIEMPGHSEEVTASYPYICCSKEPYKDSDLCPGKEETFEFLETVLSEVMDIFPSQYIHIGGDEAGKGAWRTCPDCLRRMQEEGIEDVEGLQSYMIHRIEKFVNSRGRKIIGWDEIMEGGLAPNSTVMSWRGSDKGIEAAKSGHDVIMTPGAYCYIDYNQDAPFKEPLSIGGYTPLSKVYSYEPREENVTDEDMAHILGVQANLWAEYVTEDSHAEYMYYPRVLAIAETGWSRPERKDYGDFHARALEALAQLRSRGYETFDLASEYGERQASLSPVEHLAKGAKVAYATPWHEKYPASGSETLTDGLLGGWTYGDHRWQGFLTDVDVTLDLGESMPVKYIGATFMQTPGAWVYLPEQVRIYISEDGENYVQVASVNNEHPYRDPEIVFVPFAFAGNVRARYVRLQADVYDKPGAWLFLDEIVVQ